MNLLNLIFKKLTLKWKNLHHFRHFVKVAQLCYDRKDDTASMNITKLLTGLIEKYELKIVISNVR